MSERKNKDNRNNMEVHIFNNFKGNREIGKRKKNTKVLSDAL